MKNTNTTGMILSITAPPLMNFSLLSVFCTVWSKNIRASKENWENNMKKSS